MVINKEALSDSFEVYDKETILEIIDLFFEEYPKRVKQLNTALQKHDAELLRTSAHSLKGVIAHFHAEEPHKLAKILEDKGAAQDLENSEQIKNTLLSQIEEMLKELKEIKKDYE
ncbi:MAG: Hpt domain-containing protein [Bacteroidota bacterium]